MAKFKLSKIDPESTGKFQSKDEAEKLTEALQTKMYDLLYRMYAQHQYSLLIILHGIDASGKDGLIAHIFSGSNPQGLRVHSFKKPSEEELQHDFLWRCHLKAPECGLATIFNRSYYEEVTTVKVHPELLKAQHLPLEILQRKDFFDDRYKRINDFEKLLSSTGTIVMKFLLHISKSEQRRRLEDRLKDPTKNWKFSTADVQERKFWPSYMKVFQDMIANTDTKHAPWHVLPADHKWYRNYLASQLIVQRLEKLKMDFPLIEKRIQID